MLSGIFVQRSQLIRHHEQTTSLYIVPQEVLVNTLLISFTKPHPHNWENAGVKSEFGGKKYEDSVVVGNHFTPLWPR